MKNIKKMVLVSAFAGTCLTPHAQTASPVIPTDPAIETHIREWLQKMTLEQKIGQMCEITIDVVSDLETSRKKGFCLSEAMLDTVIGKYKVGSLLNVPLGVAQKKEKWAEAIKQIQEKSSQFCGNALGGIFGDRFPGNDVVGDDSVSCGNCFFVVERGKVMSYVFLS